MPIYGQIGNDFASVSPGVGDAFGALPQTPPPAIQPFSAYTTQGGIGAFSPRSTMNVLANHLALSGDTWKQGIAGQIGGGTNQVGSMASPGGSWAQIDGWNKDITSAVSRVQQLKGVAVPANLIKALMKTESGGMNLAPNGATAMGPMQVTQSNWGNSAASMGLSLANPADNITMGTWILADNYTKYKDWATSQGIDPWKAAVYAYYAGNPFDLSAHDDPSQGGSGMSTGQYGNQIWTDYQVLNSSSTNARPTPTDGLWGGNATGQGIVAIAQQYLGTPYVWGGIPGKGQSPTSQGGGWDCSGFTYWLDQNFGGGTLPMGSHYQYQQAADQGRLFHDMSQLQPGDLIFFDTDSQGGGGSELNTASHVAMYIGNGQIIHAANPDAGTIISNLNNGYYDSRFMGAEHMSWSGGGAGIPGLAPTSFNQKLQARSGFSPIRNSLFG